MTTVEDKWAIAKDALSTLDAIRPNPKRILSATITVKHGYRAGDSTYYSAMTPDGREYCFLDWAADNEGPLTYYYGYRGGDGLIFQNKLQEELKKRGVIDALHSLQRDHDVREGKSPLTEEEFLAFMTENDILVPGPLPAPIESEVQGAGAALWMPGDLFRLTSYYGWVDRKRV